MWWKLRDVSRRVQLHGRGLHTELRAQLRHAAGPKDLRWGRLWRQLWVLPTRQRVQRRELPKRVHSKLLRQTMRSERLWRSLRKVSLWVRVRLQRQVLWWLRTGLRRQLLRSR